MVIVLVAVLIVLAIIIIFYLRKRSLSDSKGDAESGKGGANKSKQSGKRSPNKKKAKAANTVSKSQDTASKSANAAKSGHVSKEITTTTKQTRTSRAQTENGLTGGLPVPPKPGDDGYLDMAQRNSPACPRANGPHPKPSPGGIRRPLPSIKDNEGEKPDYENRPNNVYEEIKDDSSSYYLRPTKTVKEDKAYQSLEPSAEYTALQDEYIELTTPPNDHF